MIRRPPRSTQSRSSAASDVYKRQHYNSADPDFPFEKRQGVLIERGIGAPYTLVKEKTLYWLGDDRIFYMAGGYTEVRISDHVVEESIAIGEISDAHSY